MPTGYRSGNFVEDRRRVGSYAGIFPWEVCPGLSGRLAERCGLDAAAIWEWGVVERVASGLRCTRINLQPLGRHMLEAADRLAAL
jgi:hypothetical protein